MGALDFTWNMHQSGQIDDLDEKVEALEKDMATARAWVEYLNERLTKYETMFNHMPPEAMTDEEKRAYAFGWFKALEVERMKDE